ncbi:MAG: hypothetical protein ACYTXY_07430 [Nostoc sp.]
MPNTSASRFLSVAEGQYKCPMPNAQCPILRLRSVQVPNAPIARFNF